MLTPSDWPQDDALNLSAHDLPHQSSDTEWWYFNCHLSDDNQYDYSLFACFFMHRVPEQKDMAYSAIWALSDCQTKQCFTFSSVDKHTPTIALQQLTKNAGTDLGLTSVFEEMLQQEKLPTTDQLISSVSIADNELNLQFDQLGLCKNEHGEYLLTLTNPTADIQVKLQFKPQKPVCRQGDKGVIAGPNQECMYYYFIPRCQVTGHIQRAEHKPVAVKGQGWYDHEFGFHLKTDEQPSPNSWTWISIQLDNDYELSIYKLYQFGDEEKTILHCTLINPDGEQCFFNEARLTAKAQWKSMVTFSDYECHWTIDIDEIDLSLDVIADFTNQEFPTLIAYPAFWEGRCMVKGTFMGNPVSGISYVEQLLAERMSNLRQVFNSVSEQVDIEIKKLLPLQVDKQHYVQLFASEAHQHYLDDVNCQQLADIIIAPIRTITDRGGKRWRSFALSACCHLVGGQFDKYISWLAVPEFIHTGSLIIDDIQDKSSVRRGGPTCHQIFGEPLAMNAGSLAYGLFEIVLNQSDLSTEAKFQIYQLFFDTYRAAHAGQALDLVGFLPEFIRSIESKEGNQLERQILATHRLKTAVPASLLAKMGGVLGGGTQQQANQMAQYFEAVGIAFQIIDDVLNLRGFENKRKQTAEDITAGKVTYPIAKSLSFLKKDELYWIGEVLQCNTENSKSHKLIIERLESSGVFEACCQEARSLLDDAWKELDSAFPHSHTKTVLRTFSHYIIHRTV